MYHIYKNEGLTAIYKGLIMAIYREAIFGTIRVGVYEPIKEFLGYKDKANTPLYA